MRPRARYGAYGLNAHFGTAARASWAGAIVIAAAILAFPARPAPAAAQADELPVLATGGAMPDAWIDEDTGHRVVRISRQDGSNRSFYFHNDPFLPKAGGSGHLMVYYGSTDIGSQIFVLDLDTLQSRQLTHHQGRIYGEILGTGRREVFYQSGDTVFATHVDTGETRVVFVFPEGFRGSVATLNADETLLAGGMLAEPPSGRGGFEGTFEARTLRRIFTIHVESAQYAEHHEDRAWLNHFQFSPTDSDLLMFCHEGPWHRLDRIWTLDLGTGEVVKRHTRTVDREIAGHEFWGRDGETLWYDLQVPRGEVFYLAGANLATGDATRYRMTRDEWSIHFNISPDQTLFAGDGGDSTQVARAENGMWLYLFRPDGDMLASERLVNMSRHDYDLEPNVHFSPNGEWIVFRANFEGESQVYAVAVKREPGFPLTSGGWRGQPATMPGDDAPADEVRAAGLSPVPLTRGGPLEWPVTGLQQRPWTRWWWQGSAVTLDGITAAVERYAEAGLGGVEITPIYGVAGHESEFVDYLSPAWMDRLEHTLREARRVGMQVDMATGTGWPFGGPTVAGDDAAAYAVYRTYTLEGGRRLDTPIVHTQEPLLRAIGNRTQVPEGAPDHPLQDAGRERLTLDDLARPVARTPDLQALALEQVRFPDPLPLEAVVARSEAGAVVDLTHRVGAGGMLDWTAPDGTWTLHAVFRGQHGKMVERAAPAGEGYALDHFSADAVDAYLGHFSEAFQGRDTDFTLRAFFNDSYEVDDAVGVADWTPALLDAFRERRGYDLLPHIPALFGEGDPDVSARVLTDYRETVSDLLLDRFTRRWERWAQAMGGDVRNQAHGSPANILDLYAAADMPETEGSELLRFAFATSAAHTAGKPLAAAEAATWLDDHFLSSLEDVKEAVDRYFLGGVNHIVYHGTAYSPEAAPWPGWLFYAAVHLQPTSPQWTDFRALNDYVARAQSVLQGGRPGADILLYLPVHDRWERRDDELLVHLDGMEPFRGLPVAEDAARLLERGYAFDLVSDRQLRRARYVERRIRTVPSPHAGTYRAVVVPDARLLPPATLEALLTLADAGATVVFHGGLPDDVPGLADLEARRAALHAAVVRLRFTDDGGIRRAPVGTGAVLVGDDLDAVLAAAGVVREALVDRGLQAVRRIRSDGVDYFLVNTGDHPVDGWVPFAAELPAAALFDPMTGQTGVARTREARASAGSAPPEMNASADAAPPDAARAGSGRADGVRGEETPVTEVYLQLDPGESLIVRGYDRGMDGPAFPHFQPGEPRVLDGWRITFSGGGPTLPAGGPAAVGSWTDRGPGARDFAGTAVYTVEFGRPAEEAPAWRLDLGRVHESARVVLNGRELATRIAAPFRVDIPAERLGEWNTLEVYVSNLMANRIAALDRAGVAWKRFYNVNFPANRRTNVGPDGLFDASGWEPLPSGLLGPVTLAPLTPVSP